LFQDGAPSSPRLSPRKNSLKKKGRTLQAGPRLYPRQDANSKQFVGFTADLTDKESVEYKKLTHFILLIDLF